MNGLSIVIPSKNFANLRRCVEALDENHFPPPKADTSQIELLDTMNSPGEENAKLIVVDDGLAETGYCPESSAYENGAFLDGATILPGLKPFCFPRNCNIGIRSAGTHDVILLNDDALLQTHGGFTLMQKAAEEHPEFGIVSATTNNAGNRSQYPQGIGLREEPRVVAFVCVFIPRRTIDAVGLMDERFGGFMTPPDGRRIYGWCDNDYCRRIREAGLKIGIHDGCFVDHGSLTSSFRGDPRAAGDISAGAELYQQKWGDRN